MLNKTEVLLGKDLQQDNNQDIIVSDNDYILTQNEGCITQKLINKIKSTTGNLYQDYNWGGLYQSLVSKLITGDTLGTIQQKGKREFLEEEEVKEVNKFSVVLDTRRNRIFNSISVKYRDDTESTISETFNIK